MPMKSLRPLVAADKGRTRWRLSSFSERCGLAALALLAACWTVRHLHDASRHPAGWQPSALPWVFTVNGDSSAEHIRMVKRSVRSLAATGGTLRPFCLYIGPSQAPILEWLTSRGVLVHHLHPKWAERLWADASKRTASNARLSHLYGSEVSLVATFARIDIPLAPMLQNYTHVLYTDNDVYFRGPVTLEGLGELPASISMSYEMLDTFPYNAGVMVMNLTSLRATYQDFVDFILNHRGSMRFGRFGPGDQGAYNEFYKDSLTFLSEDYNAKVYKPYNGHAKIVHFHGPKPEQYIEQLQTGACSFPNKPSLCRRGLAGFCMYPVRDRYFAGSPDQHRELGKACEVLRREMEALHG